MNRYNLIGLTKGKEQDDIRYRIANTSYPDKGVEIVDFDDESLVQNILEGFIVENISADYDWREITGTRGELSRYGDIESDTPQPLVVISNINNQGYRCIDINGKVYEISNDRLIEYARNFGLANAEYNGHSITGINWTIPMDETISWSRLSADARDSLKKQVSKIQLLGLVDEIKIDINTGTLYKYKARANKKVILPEGIKTIFTEAIELDGAVEELIIPEGVECIEHNAIDGRCDYIKELVLPDSLEVVHGTITHFKIGSLTIGTNTEKFYITELIVDSKFIVSADNESYASIDGILYSKDKKHMLFVPYVYHGDIIVPEECEDICTEQIHYDLSDCVFRTIDLSKSKIQEDSIPYGATLSIV